MMPSSELEFVKRASIRRLRRRADGNPNYYSSVSSIFRSLSTYLVQEELLFSHYPTEQPTWQPKSPDHSDFSRSLRKVWTCDVFLTVDLSSRIHLTGEKGLGAEACSYGLVDGDDLMMSNWNGTILGPPHVRPSKSRSGCPVPWAIVY
jgi:hypothetical protein